MSCNNCGCGSSRTLFTNNADIPQTAIMANASEWPAPEPGSGFMPVIVSSDGLSLSVLAQRSDKAQPAKWVKVRFQPEQIGIEPVDVGV